MYSDENLQQCRDHFRKTAVRVLVPVAVLFVLMIVSFVLRWSQALTVILSIMCFSLLAFGWLGFCVPLRQYRKHVEHALNGRTRQTEGRFMSMEEEPVTREGLRFYPFMINVGEQQLPKDDRLFYYDALLPRPAWQPGQRLCITSYDNRVTDWKDSEITAQP